MNNAPANVRMNNILPGFIDSLPEKEVHRKRIPMGRYGTMDEIAESVAFLLIGRRKIHHRPKYSR